MRRTPSLLSLGWCRPRRTNWLLSSSSIKPWAGVGNNNGLGLNGLRPCVRLMSANNKSMPFGDGRRTRFAPLWRKYFLSRHNSFSFLYRVEPVGGKVVYDFSFAGGPKDFYAIKVVVRSQAEVDAQVVLRQIAAPAADLIDLNQVSGEGLEAGIQRQTIAFGSRQFKFDPVVMVAALVAKDERLAINIFNDDVDAAVVEQIAEGRAAADLGDANGGASQFADVAKGSVVLVQEQEFGLAIAGADIERVHLRVDVAVHHKKIRPSIVIEIEKCGAPTNVGDGW